MFAIVFLCQAAFAQTCCIRVTLDPGNMNDVGCNMQGATKAYMHSGLCTAGHSTCVQLANTGSPVWMHVVGNWPSTGPANDDGVGQMVSAGNGKWKIEMNIDSYFSSTQVSSEGSGPMQSGTAFYSMGMVFRNEDGSIEGKNDIFCGDFFILGLDGANPYAVAHDNGPTQAITVEWITEVTTGISKTESNVGIDIFPNPSTTGNQIALSLENYERNVSVSIVNHLGQTMAQLFNGDLNSGSHEFFWNGKSGSGKSVSAGIYTLLVSGTSLSATTKIIVN